MADPRFVTNAQGERVGVILDLATYEQMLGGKKDPEVLLGMSEVELMALAQSELSPGHQQQLGSLQEKRSVQALSEDETKRLDSILEQIDYLNTLKARARYTLQLRSTPRE